MLAEEVVLFRGGETGMAVGAARQAELERVHAEQLLEFQALLQRATRIFALNHAGLLWHASQVGLVPFVEIGELVARRKRRMGLAVTLDLGSLLHRLPLCARFSPFARQRVARKGLEREHLAV